MSEPTSYALDHHADPDFIDDNDDIGNSNTPEQSTIGQKKRYDALAQILCEQVGNEMDREELDSAQKIEDEQLLSLKQMMQKQKCQPIIPNAREYQMELFETAKAQNTIAVLDTGSGKTLIAVLLLKHIIELEVADRAAGKLPKVAFFLVSITISGQ